MTINAELANIAASLAMLGTGMVIHFYFRPSIFTVHPFVRNAFQLGTFFWWFFVFEWILIQTKLELHMVLAVFDIQSMMQIAFCWMFFSGDKAKLWQLVLALIISWGFLTWWNYNFADSGNPGPLLGVGPLWIRASEFTSGIATALLAIVFLLRYRAYAIPFAIMQLVYAVLQTPAYNKLFSPASAPDSEFSLLVLATGKVIWGSLFYLMFFLPGNYSSFQLPSLSLDKMGVVGTKIRELVSNPTLRKIFRWTLGVLGVLLLHILAGLIVDFIRDSVWFHRH